MTPASIHALRAEIASDHRAFEARVAELAAVDLDDVPAAAALSHAAVAVHHAFSAVEAALLRATRLLEGEVPSGVDWHVRLLERCALDIPSVRPPLLSPATVAALRRMLAFRHFFRHAYAVAWDADRLRALRTQVLDAREPLARDWQAMDAFLADVAEKLG